MRSQIFNVFEDECRWTQIIYDAGNVKKERALCRMLKSMGNTERIVLCDTGNTEWLAGETGGKNIVGWNSV